MTAEEILEKQDCNGYASGEIYGTFYYEKEDILKAMKEFAELKCKELLEIVAENAEAIEGYNTGFSGSAASVDKESILNVVDLKEFIK